MLNAIKGPNIHIAVSMNSVTNDKNTSMTVVAILSSINETRLHMHRSQYITDMYKYTFLICYLIFIRAFFFPHPLKICELKPYCPTSGYITLRTNIYYVLNITHINH
jgi:uncharacterized membrane protein YozB (DUF420 family)